MVLVDFARHSEGGQAVQHLSFLGDRCVARSCLLTDILRCTHSRFELTPTSEGNRDMPTRTMGEQITKNKAELTPNQPLKHHSLGLNCCIFGCSGLSQRRALAAVLRYVHSPAPNAFSLIEPKTNFQVGMPLGVLLPMS